MSCRVDVSLLKRRTLRLFMNAFFSCTGKVNRERHAYELHECVLAVRNALQAERGRARAKESADARTHTLAARIVCLLFNQRSELTHLAFDDTRSPMCAPEACRATGCACVRLESRRHIVAVGRANRVRVDAMGIGRWKRRGSAVRRCMCATFLSEAKPIQSHALSTTTCTCHCTTLFSFQPKMISFSLRSAFRSVGCSAKGISERENNILLVCCTSGCYGSHSGDYEN